MSRTLIEEIATLHGFLAPYLAPIHAPIHADRYSDWLKSGHHGEMSYLERGLSVRLEPRERVPEAKSVLILRIPYHHKPPPDPGGFTGKVARYAWGRDYHNLIGKRLKKVQRRLREVGIRSWGGVDTAPILERSWASMAGLGFNGKNTMQIIPASGSYFFIAALFLDVEIDALPRRLGDHCGSCSRCIDACPTEAFVDDRNLDARKCIAYWTIEAKGLAPRELRPKFDRWLFGCDVCQEVCPHNVNPPEATEDDFLPKNAFIDLPELLEQDDSLILERFTGTPLRRPGASGLKRNALFVLGNIGDDTVVPVVTRCLQHPEPVVRAAAIWCLARLGRSIPEPSRAEHELVLDEYRAAIDGAIATLGV